MTITVGGAVRDTNTNTGTNPKTVTLASDVPANATIILGILNRTDETTTLSSVTDPVNGTWSLGTALRQGPTDSVASVFRTWFLALTGSSALTGATDRTLTVTFSTGISAQLVAMWVSSDQGALTFDQVATVLNTASVDTNFDSNTISVPSAGAIVGFLAVNNSQGSTAPTADGAGETLQTTAADAGAYRSNLFSQLVASAGTHGFETTIAVSAVGHYHVLSLLEPTASTTVTPTTGAATLNGRTPTTSAFQNVRIREVLVNASGQAVGSHTDIGLRVWYGGICRGAPDVSLNGLTTDANGTTSWSIATGTLAFNDPIFYVAQNSVSYSTYTAARLVPSYE